MAGEVIEGTTVSIHPRRQSKRLESVYHTWLLKVIQSCFLKKIDVIVIGYSLISQQKHLVRGLEKKNHGLF